MFDKLKAMNEIITKKDLWEFGLSMMNNFRKMLESLNDANDPIDAEWVKSKVVRKMLDISPKSVQNLRIGGKVRCKKVIGTYYYNKSDIIKLFYDGKGKNEPQ